MEAISTDDTQGTHIELPAVSRRLRVRRSRCKQHGILHLVPSCLSPAAFTRLMLISDPFSSYLTTRPPPPTPSPRSCEA